MRNSTGIRPLQAGLLVAALTTLTSGIASAAAPAHQSSAAVAADPATAARAQAKAAFARLQALAPTAEAMWNDRAPGPRAILGLELTVAGSNPTERALQFVRTHGLVFGAPGSEWRVIGKSHMTDRDVIQLAQWHRVAGDAWLPVLDRTTTITMDGAGKLLQVVNDALPVGAVAPAKLAEGDARRAAVLGLSSRKPNTGAQLADASAGQLGLLVTDFATRLVWGVEVGAKAKVGRFAVYVDAHTGEVVQIRSLARH